MTKLLEQAMAEASKLSAEEQDAIATLLLEELDAGRRWDESFADSQDFLDRLYAQGVADIGAGRTRALDPDEM